MSQIVLYFLHSTSVLSFCIDVVLTLSIYDVPGLDLGWPEVNQLDLVLVKYHI